MIGLQDRPATLTTYQDWLDLFAWMKQLPLSSDEDFSSLSQATFTGTTTMHAALQRQLVDTINALLDKSAKRFVRDLNACITFHELSQADTVFKRFKRDIQRATFFLDLSFLPEPFKQELYRSVTQQMSAFWADTIRFLQRQAAEHPGPDLEDALFLIRRIKLFS